MWLYNRHIIVESHMPRGEMREMLEVPRTFWDNCHVRYPADEDGAHLTRFFSIENIASSDRQLWRIVEDLSRWLRIAKLRDTWDVVLAPAQPGVDRIANLLAAQFTSLSPQHERRCALWEYHPTGRFGDKLVEGEIRKGDRVLVYNGVTQQGRCVGQRLPMFAESLGGNVVAAAVFAKGTSALVRETEKRYGDNFYAALQVDIPVFSAQECRRCRMGEAPIPWTELMDAS